MKIVELPDNKIAANSDGDSKVFTEAFEELEEFSNLYIKEMLNIGGYPAAYPWPVDNLHNWSRWWEYAYVWLYLKPLLQKGKKIKVLDIGPGLTFWPFFLADKGFEVTAVDIDDRIKNWADTATRKLTCLDLAAKRRLKFVTGDITRPKFAGAGFEAATNISVIEHVDDKRKAINEIFRLLKSGGKLINTLDISLDGRPIGDSRPLLVQESYEFIRMLENAFNQKIRFDFVHPMDIVTPGRYPPKYTDGSLYVSKFHLTRQIWKILSSRLSVKFLLSSDRLDMWTVMGMAVQKSSIRR